MSVCKNTIFVFGKFVLVVRFQKTQIMSVRRSIEGAFLGFPVCGCDSNIVMYVMQKLMESVHLQVVNVSHKLL